MADSNGRHPRCKRGSTTTEAVADSGLAETPPAVCTRVCTSEAENEHADPLEALAAELRESLSTDALVRLTELLADDPDRA